MNDIKKDEIIEVDITDLNNLGNGVGRYPDKDGKVVCYPVQTYHLGYEP